MIKDLENTLRQGPKSAQEGTQWSSEDIRLAAQWRLDSLKRGYSFVKVEGTSLFLQIGPFSSESEKREKGYLSTADESPVLLDKLIEYYTLASAKFPDRAKWDLDTARESKETQ